MDRAEMFRNLRQVPGKNVVLEPLAMPMADDLLAALLESETELRRYMSWDCWTIEDAKAFLARAMIAIGEGERLEMAIRSREGGAFLGVIGLKAFDPFTPLAEVGYWVRSSSTRKGYASDALSAVVDFCQHGLQLKRLDARVAATNIASQGVVLKCGFEKEGLKRNAELCHGQWHDLVLYGKLLD